MEFTPLGFLNSDKKGDIVLVLLNQDYLSAGKNYQVRLETFKHLWNKAYYRASVDGGTNVLHRLNETLSQKYVPDLISGDFDSVDQNLLEMYRKMGSEIYPTPDQDNTDFTKCILILGEKCKTGLIPPSVRLVVPLLGSTDRFDHCMANINTLYTAQDVLPKTMSICLLFGDSYMCLLKAGTTVLNLNTGFEAGWCTFTPLTAPAVVSTSGLRTNFVKSCLKFDVFNNLRSEFDGTNVLTVETDQPLLFTLPIITPITK